ncbi:hypothetical protein MAR_034891 [Mya arenaria]|uniref:Uncharacterized protein n=1 Tax=Mya arenaria TaxID=6604 RepID=A0ABY7EIJ7_MYAAR|nr:hypothetical protein MAR_034891 [Mya arenaria]
MLLKKGSLSPRQVHGRPQLFSLHFTKDVTHRFFVDYLMAMPIHCLVWTIVQIIFPVLSFSNLWISAAVTGWSEPSGFERISISTSPLACSDSLL